MYVIWFLAAVNFRNRNRTIIRLSNRRPIDLQNVENYYCQSVEFIAIHEQILQKVRGANSWWKTDVAKKLYGLILYGKIDKSGKSISQYG